jgi:UDP-3-O-[3-hydroxymyristoyl] glucosamine N-acyltransferase
MYTLADLAEKLNARLVGEGTVVISGIAPLYRAGQGEITFLLASIYKSYLTSTTASAVVLSEQHLAGYAGNALVVKDPSLSYAQLASLFSKKPELSQGIHPSAVVSASAILDPSVSIGAHCVVGNRVTIGAGTRIGHGTVIGDDCQLGEACQLAANVTLYSDVKLKDRVMIHSGVVLGADGFGLVNDRGRWVKIPQLGGVTLGNDVEIGANTTIDRGAMDDTVLEDGVKCDNQIQIGHNVQIGAHTAIAGCVGIAGSTKIGKHCMIGGASAIADHLVIADQVILTGAAQVSQSISEPGVYSSGLPVQPRLQWHRHVIRSRQLDQLFSRVKKLEQANNE